MKSQQNRIELVTRPEPPQLKQPLKLLRLPRSAPKLRPPRNVSARKNSSFSGSVSRKRQLRRPKLRLQPREGVRRRGRGSGGSSRRPKLLRNDAGIRRDVNRKGLRRRNGENSR